MTLFWVDSNPPCPGFALQGAQTTQTSYTIPGLTPEHTYNLALAAVDAAGMGPVGRSSAGNRRPGRPCRARDCGRLGRPPELARGARRRRVLDLPGQAIHPARPCHLDAAALRSTARLERHPRTRHLSGDRSQRNTRINAVEPGNAAASDRRDPSPRYRPREHPQPARASHHGFAPPRTRRSCSATHDKATMPLAPQRRPGSAAAAALPLTRLPVDSSSPAADRKKETPLGKSPGSSTPCSRIPNLGNGAGRGGRPVDGPRGVLRLGGHSPRRPRVSAWHGRCLMTTC